MSKRIASAGSACLVIAGLAAAWFGLQGGTGQPTGISAPDVAWVFEAREAGAIISTPAVDAGRMYVSAIRDVPAVAHGAVICLDAATGKTLWTFDDDGRMLHMYSSCTLAEGRLYVGEGMHANPQCKLYCLAAEDGRKLWDFTAAGHIESTPVVAGDCVLFGAGDDGLYCLDAVTGKQRWHYREDRHVDATVAVHEDRVYATSGISRRYPQSAVFCLDLQDGRRIWETPTDLPAWGSPMLAGAALVVGLGNGRLAKSAEPPAQPAGAALCLAAEDGRVRWRLDVPDGVMARPLIHEERVYFGCRDGFAYCIDLDRGELLWKRDLQSPLVAAPTLVDGGVLLAASEGQVYLLDLRRGTIVWMFDLAAHSGLKSRLWSTPACMLRALIPALASDRSAQSWRGPWPTRQWLFVCCTRDGPRPRRIGRAHDQRFSTQPTSLALAALAAGSRGRRWFGRDAGSDSHVARPIAGRAVLCGPAE